MSEKTHPCSDAGCDKTSCENCDHTTAPDFSAPLHAMSTVKKVIGIVSGKGGVGKSVVTSLLASAMHKAHHRTAVLDADITGPSIPKTFGLHGKANATEIGLLPMQTASGIEIISTNLLLNDETDPVVWRGPIIAGTVKQFWSDVIWTDIDYMFIDMPPGTGDVPLTVFQSLPIDGIIIVTSPQELVSMIVGKAVKMASLMNIPILGLIENYSYFKCPDNGKEYQIFGPSHIETAATAYGLDVLGRLPIDPELAVACDAGRIETYHAAALDPVVERLKNLA